MLYGDRIYTQLQNGNSLITPVSRTATSHSVSTSYYAAIYRPDKKMFPIFEMGFLLLIIVSILVYTKKIRAT